MTTTNSLNNAYVMAVNALNSNRIRYVAMRGHENWPEISSDLDLLVHPEDLERAIQACRDSIDRKCDVVGTCRHIDVPVIFAGQPDWPMHLLEIDFATTTTWAGGPYIDVRGVMARRKQMGDVWVADDGDQSVLLGLAAFFGSQSVRDSKGKDRLPKVRRLYDDNPDLVREAWARAVGRDAAAIVINAIEVNDLSSLNEIATRTRRMRVLKNLISHPIRTLKRILFVRWSRARAADCGLWYAKGATLLPVRHWKEFDQPWDVWLRAVGDAHRNERVR